jgi:GxxExxY protein
MIENEVSGQIVDAAIEVHRTLGGPGLLESVYEEALVWNYISAAWRPNGKKYFPFSIKAWY